MTLEGLQVAFVAGTLGQGGAERQLYYALTALSNAGASPTVLSLTRGEHWQAPIEQLGVPVAHVGSSSSRIGRAWSIARAVMALRPQVVQSFHFYTNLYAALGARAGRVPSVGALRSDGANELRTIGPTLARWSLNWPTVIAANSTAAITNVTATGCTTPLVLLRNAIDLGSFAYSPVGPLDTIRVAAIGRLGPEKRFDRLLRIIAIVARTGRKVHARIAGGGPLRAELEEQVRTQHLESHVELLGPQDDIRPLLQWSTCVALTSDFEGTPNVLLEAMAIGRAVLATRVGGVPFLVDDNKTGLLIDPGDDVGFARALVDLHDSPSVNAALVTASREYVEEHHSIASLGRALAALYARVL